MLHNKKKGGIVFLNELANLGISQEFITNIGFPIAVSLFFIFKLDKSITQLQKSLDDLVKLITEREKNK